MPSIQQGQLWETLQPVMDSEFHQRFYDIPKREFNVFKTV